MPQACCFFSLTFLSFSANHTRRQDLKWSSNIQMSVNYARGVSNQKLEKYNDKYRACANIDKNKMKIYEAPLNQMKIYFIINVLYANTDIVNEYQMAL